MTCRRFSLAAEIPMSADDYKRQAAAEALKLVEPEMKLGLGTGSTAEIFVELLGVRVKQGLKVLCVPTSEATRKQAEALGIPLTTLDETPFLDMTIDGADEVDSELRLIKGGGGAHLREKIVAMASERLIVIADHTKLVDKLGRFALPVEVIEFGARSTQSLIEALASDAGCRGAVTQRMKDGAPFRTDNGNFILDCAYGQIDDPEALAAAFEMIPGVVEHGLFLGVCDIAFIAGPDGVEVLEAEDELA
jgi:ribose 5-phosphate isomerase A